MIYIEIPLSNREQMLSNAKKALVSACPDIMNVGCKRARLVEYKKTKGALKLTYEQFESDWEADIRTTGIANFRLAPE